ncbi:MAG: glutamine-hydrolyzing carbamoyl-phosphate synthase small subunit [Acidobacteriota bacterium]|nr:glutamine-hydrolyzing carbamoyl-phosphate synthase small subunit [Acidobacteriota bacterium]
MGSKAMLALEDGLVFEGQSFGAEGENFGEVVFNTGMTGYQEVLTDPSYRGQIPCMTYTQIGNYGINDEDVESWRPWVEGFIVRELCEVPSNWRSKRTLSDYLSANGIIGIEGIDTRMLTRHLRTYGAKKGVISTTDLDEESLVEKAKASPSIVAVDLAKDVTCDRIREWGESGYVDFSGDDPRQLSLGLATGTPRMWKPQEQVLRAVVVDLGVKQNILRLVQQMGCQVIVVPAQTSAGEIMELEPDGVVISNGPGDPDAVTYAIDTIANLIGKAPIFGICFGQQLIALAMGGRTYKLKFGHRGVNHPVKNLRTGQVEITTQNHGFSVDIDSMQGTGMEQTHVNLNDQTIEGMRHKELPVFSVQYHPEAGPGPHDARYLFDEFRRDMLAFRGA